MKRGKIRKSDLKQATLPFLVGSSSYGEYLEDRGLCRDGESFAGQNRLHTGLNLVGVGNDLAVIVGLVADQHCLQMPDRYFSEATERIGVNGAQVGDVLTKTGLKIAQTLLHFMLGQTDALAGPPGVNITHFCSDTRGKGDYGPDVTSYVDGDGGNTVEIAALVGADYFGTALNGTNDENATPDIVSAGAVVPITESAKKVANFFG